MIARVLTYGIIGTDGTKWRRLFIAPDLSSYFLSLRTGVSHWVDAKCAGHLWIRCSVTLVESYSHDTATNESHESAGMGRLCHRNNLKPRGDVVRATGPWSGSNWQQATAQAQHLESAPPA